MNNGIKNKLKTLVGEDVELRISDYGIFITIPPGKMGELYKILRIEEDCVVLGNVLGETFLSIDNISCLYIRKT